MIITERVMPFGISGRVRKNKANFIFSFKNPKVISEKTMGKR